MINFLLFLLVFMLVLCVISKITGYGFFGPFKILGDLLGMVFAIIID